MISLSVFDASYQYSSQQPLFENVSFEITSGDLLCILGQNGTGKTTFLKCLSGILKWKKGTIRIDNELVTKNEIRNLIGYVPQMHQSAVNYSVKEMIMMGRASNLGLFSLPGRKDHLAVEEILERLDMKEISNSYCDCLSGGQLQMVYLARALVSNPRILVLDEPESHLDYKNQSKMLKLIKTVVKENNLIGIMNTHYPQHALNYSDCVLFIGKEGHAFGKTSFLLNEENLNHYYGVKTKILTTVHEDKKLFSVIAL